MAERRIVVVDDDVWVRRGRAASLAEVPGLAVTAAESLSSVACVSSTTCLAVGYNHGITHGVTVALTSGTPGTGSTVSTTTSLNGVACPKTTVCDAVGSVTNQSQVIQGVVDTVTP